MANFSDSHASLIAREAVLYYVGQRSSVEAFQIIDWAVTRYCYPAGIVNDAHALFDALVDYMVTYDGPDAFHLFNSFDFIEATR